MNKIDLETLPEGDKVMLDEAERILGLKVRPKMSVPVGYVQNERTGTILKLETFLDKVRQGLMDEADGVIGGQ